MIRRRSWLRYVDVTGNTSVTIENLVTGRRVSCHIGTLTGGWAGRQIAVWSRGKAARLILQGNQIVLQDIGEQTARFLQLLKNGATSEGREAFFAGLRPGSTERHGQDLLATAFRFCLAAFDASDRLPRAHSS
jgi:hypothetical protein